MHCLLWIYRLFFTTVSSGGASHENSTKLLKLSIFSRLFTPGLSFLLKRMLRWTDFEPSGRTQKQEGVLSRSWKRNRRVSKKKSLRAFKEKLDELIFFNSWKSIEILETHIVARQHKGKQILHDVRSFFFIIIIYF